MELLPYVSNPPYNMSNLIRVVQFTKPVTISFYTKVFKTFKLECPYLQCHRYVPSSVVVFMQVGVTTVAMMGNISFEVVILEFSNIPFS